MLDFTVVVTRSHNTIPELASVISSEVKYYCGRNDYTIESISQLYYVPEAQKFVQTVIFKLNEELHPHGM